MSEVRRIMEEVVGIEESSLADMVYQLSLMRDKYRERLNAKAVDDGRNEAWDVMNYAIAAVIRVDRAVHIAIALKEQQKRQEIAQAQGTIHHD